MQHRCFNADITQIYPQQST